MTDGTVRGSNKLQWWIMAAMWAVILTGGSAWATHVNLRISRLEKLVTEAVPTLREFKALSDRIDRIEGKIDKIIERVK
jgi:hypothetical protein